MKTPIRTVYLAGPIAGLTYQEARYGWRPRFKKLMPSYIVCASPMRAKESLSDQGVLTSDSYEGLLTSASAIVTRDFHDVRTCDAMVACFLEGVRPSLGTAVEFGWAHAFDKPIIMVAHPDDPHYRHSMLRRMAGYHCRTLEEAAHVVYHLLTPEL